MLVTIYRSAVVEGLRQFLGFAEMSIFSACLSRVLVECLPGRNMSRFLPTVLSVEPLVHCVVCLSVTFCIVAKPYVLVKNCLKE